MKPRILVFEPVLGDAIINCLLFLKKLRHNNDVFIVSLANNYNSTINGFQNFRELYPNLGFFFVPNQYFEFMNFNDCIPRINYYTSYQEQALIYQRVFPDLYLQVFNNIREILMKINPDHVLTCVGSLYIYNVLCSHFLQQLVHKLRLKIYKDNPFIANKNYACNNLCFTQRHKMYNCPSTINQKLFLNKAYNIYPIDVFPNICSNVEVIYND